MTDGTARAGLLGLAGLAALAVAWSPLPTALMRGPFAAHMTGHMLLVAVAAPLLAAALARTAPGLTALMAALCPPVPASLMELLLVWGWHAPVLHRAARADGATLVAEQASFLLAGFWLWATALARAPDGRLARGPEGILALLLTATHMTLLGVLLALAPRALFAHDHAAARGGPSPLVDQELGGIVMLVVGGVAYVTGGLSLLAELLKAPRGGDRLGPSEGREGRRCASG
jgi:putative membrane protein